MTVQHICALRQCFLEDIGSDHETISRFHIIAGANRDLAELVSFEPTFAPG